MNESFKYIGTELDLFAMAINWKAYIRHEIGRYVKGHVLEVGAGVGETTKALIGVKNESWTCLEPDRELAERITSILDKDSCCKSNVPNIIVGNIDHPACDRKYDTILYIDVLEHIKEDETEIQKAARKLNKKGCLIVLAPAHQFLYSAFDSMIGHYRRYNQKHLVDIHPSDTKLLRVRYLDSVGCLASLGNKVILRAGMPTKNQIIMWDRFMVPLSRFFDFVFGHRIGKSVYVVWQRT